MEGASHVVRHTTLMKSKSKSQSVGKPGPFAGSAELERRALALPRRLVLDAERALFQLRERGQRVSFSALVEVALFELLERHDLGTVLEKHGATARRRLPTNG